ncbi:hypothetical protein BDK51DRAFT_34260, partial [Blyttiomyces helicus]
MPELVAKKSPAKGKSPAAKTTKSLSVTPKSAPASAPATPAPQPSTPVPTPKKKRVIRARRDTRNKPKKPSLKDNGEAEEEEEEEAEGAVASGDQTRSYGWSMSTAGGKLSSGKAVFSNDTSYFFCCIGASVKVYSVSTGMVIRSLSVPSRTKSENAFSSVQLNHHNYLQIYTSSADGFVRLWDFTDGLLLQSWEVGAPILQMKSHPLFAGQVFLQTSEQLHAKGQLAHNLVLFPLSGSTNSNRRSIQKRGPVLRGFDVNEAGSFLIFATRKSFSIVNLAMVAVKRTREEYLRTFVTKDEITAVQIHPREPYVAIGDMEGKITL